MKLPGEIGDDGRNDQPQQTFDEKKHKAEKAEAFGDSGEWLFGFVRLRAFLHISKINFPEKLFNSFS